jgi:RNA polymerase-binding transcription factor DksA
MSETLSTLTTLPAEAEGSLHTWRARLDDERRFRTEQLELLEQEITANPRLRHDGVTMALRAAAAAALDDVDAALSRMRAGQFGRCVHCTRPIPHERLDVLPMAALCMPCQYEQQTRSN